MALLSYAGMFCGPTGNPRPPKPEAGPFQRAAHQADDLAFAQSGLCFNGLKTHGVGPGKLDYFALSQHHILNNNGKGDK